MNLISICPIIYVIDYILVKYIYVEENIKEDNKIHVIPYWKWLFR